MKVKTLWLLAITIALFSLLTGGRRVSADDGEDNGKFQWILCPPSPGFPQFALASDGSKILAAGSGTFEVGEPNEVTGGGTWATFDGSGAQTGGGNFRVTSLVKFNLAPGSVPGQPSFHAGLVFLHVEYDDGSRGILVVGCNLGPPTPPSVAEGFSASKGFVDYWNGFNGLTLFVALGESKD